MNMIDDQLGSVVGDTRISPDSTSAKPGSVTTRAVPSTTPGLTPSPGMMAAWPSLAAVSPVAAPSPIGIGGGIPRQWLGRRYCSYSARRWRRNTMVSLMPAGSAGASSSSIVR